MTSRSEVLVIGLDAAVDFAKRGAVLGVYAKGDHSVDEVLAPSARAFADRLANISARTRVLLCVDAPLGWPAALPAALQAHRAGEPVAKAPDDLFRRETDRWVKREIDQQPFDVGADKIARTAHAALTLLAELRDLTDRMIPLAWRRDFPGLACIEVYPAATLKAHKLSCKQYKGSSDRACATRTEVARQFGFAVAKAVRQAATVNDHVFDATICAMAGFDFLAGHCSGPTNPDLALREGWIWVRQPVTQTPKTRLHRPRSAPR